MYLTLVQGKNDSPNWDMSKRKEEDEKALDPIFIF